MSRKVTLSLAQIDIAWGQPEANLAKTEQWVTEASRRGSDLVLFPELWTTSYDLDRAAGQAAELGPALFTRLGDLARRNSIFLAGSTIRPVDGRFYNSAVLFAPDGQLVETYDKIHLFRPLGEDQFFVSGERTPLFDLPWGRGALAICYDLRFPELLRKYGVAGAEMVFLPAEWPYPRLEHWRTLLRARAIENQSFYVACNRVGHGGDSLYFGHSSIIDPRGQAVLEGGESELLLTATIDLDEVAAVRNQMTVFQDRHPNAY